MNVTEQQKRILLQYMTKNSDFGRGRLRYNKENKRKINEMWTEIATRLNCTGIGPHKREKEWAKTWRDWKSNVLKKVAVVKSNTQVTGGGPHLEKVLSPLEEELLEFLTSGVSGMSSIPERGIPSFQVGKMSPEYANEEEFIPYDFHLPRINTVPYTSDAREIPLTQQKTKKLKIDKALTIIEKHNTLTREILELKRRKLTLLEEDFKFRKQAHREIIKEAQNVIEEIRSFKHEIMAEIKCQSVD